METEYLRFLLREMNSMFDPIFTTWIGQITINTQISENFLDVKTSS